MIRKILLCTAMLLPTQALALDSGSVTRIDANRIELTWRNASVVDIFVSTDPDADVDSANKVGSGDRDGREFVAADTRARRYFLLRDRASGQVERIAERILPLQGGSNFRDLGGYPAVGGKTVKWGKIFRSAALARLTEGDYALLATLNIGAIIDLRSIEERTLAPTELDDRTGALFLANDYSVAAMSANVQLNPDQSSATVDNPYAGLPPILRPQLRSVFNRLLAGEGGVLFNCWGGQDRTGITSALILSALGVSRERIIEDYHLTTQARRPENELPLVTPVAAASNPIMKYYVEAAKSPGELKSQALYGKDGLSFLVKFFGNIEQQYGSIDAYLERELGLTPAKVAKLRAMYLEGGSAHP